METTIKPSPTLQKNTLNTAHTVGVILETVHVSARFAPHYFNLNKANSDTAHGINNMILDILKKNHCTNQAGIENTFRQVALSRSMTFDEVFAEVQKKYDNTQGRYNEQTVKNALSYFLKREKKVIAFRMTKNEDLTRGMSRCRSRYYIPA